MLRKLKAHLWSLPRWFGAPYFGSSLLLGVLLAGGWGKTEGWLGLLGGLFIMAGGHSWNSALDYWTGLDKGEVADRSAEKAYTGGQNLIENGTVSLAEIVINALAMYAVAAFIFIFVMHNTSWPLMAWMVLGMLDTVWYAMSKFNYTHELALAFGVGPCAAMIGMYSVSANPDWLRGLLTSVPLCLIFSWAGLALDEWPDAEANLKKGVKSLAYMVWKCGYSLELYLSFWFIMAYLFQVALIAIGYLNRGTLVTFLLLPFIAACLLFLKNEFKKAAGYLVLVFAFYPVLILLGQWAGGK